MLDDGSPNPFWQRLVPNIDPVAGQQALTACPFSLRRLRLAVPIEAA